MDHDLSRLLVALNWSFLFNTRTHRAHLIRTVPEWAAVLKAFRSISQLQLPCDQINALYDASKMFTGVHAAVERNKARNQFGGVYTTTSAPRQ